MDSSTGGGTASAVSGAMAAALAAMVARLSMGRPGMEAEAYYTDIASEAESLSRELFDGGRRDAESFDGVMAALHLPKASEEEKAARRAALSRANLKAAQVPLANAGACRKVLDLCRLLDGRSNPNAGSDLECAGHLALAGLKGCLANVVINLPGIKDPEQADLIKTRADLLGRLD